MTIEAKPDVDVSSVFLIGLLSCLLVFFVVVTMQAWYYTVRQAEVNRKVYTKPAAELQLYRSNEYNKLHSYQWVDPASKTVSIPIEQAISITAKELSAQ